MWAADSNLNDARLDDPEYDRLLAVAATKSGNERLDALGLAETRLLSGAAVLPLYHSLAANVVDTDFVNGWYPNALDIHPFKYLVFGERRVRSNVAALSPAEPEERE
jgi:peptide/nickel transport system substrate-binding protein/oligopeptide transport system substrate-binding protein